MGDVDDEVLALRNIAHRMSQGIEIKSRSYGMLQFRNVFLGKVCTFPVLYTIDNSSCTRVTYAFS